MTSYIKILQKLDAFCTAHLQIKKFMGEFREQMPNFSTMDERYPIVFASPISDVEDLNTNQFTLEIYCVDIIQKDRANLNTIVSDCHLILKDLFIYYRDDNDADLDVVGTASISFVNNFDLDYVAGAVMTITFEVAGYGSCEIPMSPITPVTNDCEPATLVVKDSDDNILYTLVVDSGATDTQIIADSTAELYFDNELIDSMQILAEGSDAFNIDCSTTINAVRVTSVSLSHAHTGTFVYVGDVNGKPSYEKSDDADRIIYYDGTRWILEKLGGGAHTHEAAIGNEAFPWLADWSLEDILMIQATIGTYCVNGGDALNILVNGTIEGDVNNAYPVEIELTDGTNPVTPDAVTIIGNTVTIEVPAATPAPVGATLMKTGQTTSYRTGDDGDIEAGRATDFFTLASNNPFGNTLRFTGLIGGGYDGVDFRDENGNIVTGTTIQKMDGAFPDYIMLDWSTYNGVNVLGYYANSNQQGLSPSGDLGQADNSWNSAIDGALTFSVLTYTSGWKCPNFNEMNNVNDYSRTNFGNNVIVGGSSIFWTSTTFATTTTAAYRFAGGTGVPSTVAKTTTSSSYRIFPVRTFTVTGTTLT
jgi:hypothetical protein